MRKGPISQLRIREILRIFTFLKTLGSILYLTFARGGYIIKIKPMAKGILVVPLLYELMFPGMDGN